MGSRRSLHRSCAPVVEGLERRTLFSTLTLDGVLGNGTVTSPTDLPDTTPPLYGMTAFRGGLLYVNNDGVHGSELYRTDGTQAGTVMVKDINPGVKSSTIGRHTYEYEQYAAPFVFRNVAYFSADDGAHGVTLWRSDGTTAGTYRVATATAPFYPEYFVPAGNVLFFECLSTTGGSPELWRTDGTSAGTFRLSDTVRVEKDYSSGPHEPATAAIGSTLYFRREVGGSDELWKSDGTLAGTVRVATDPLLRGAELYAAGNQVFLLDRPHNRLFTYVPGSGAIAFVADLPMPFDAEYVHYTNVTTLNGRLLFEVEFQPRDSGIDLVAQVWVSNGTAAGTRSLVGDTFDRYTKADPFGAPIVMGSNAYFPVGQSLWKTDGTRGGTGAVHTFADAWPTQLLAGAGVVYFQTGYESTARLWKSNGTDAGTVAVTDPSAAAPFYDPAYTLVGSRIYYRGADPVRESEVTWIDVASAGAAAPAQVRGVVPQVDYSPRKRRLYVTGSRYNDRVTVAANVKRGRLTVTYNGLASTFRLADVGSVVVTGGDGGDVLTLAGPLPGASVSGDDGNDTLTGGDLGDLLDGGAGADHLLGGAGDDDLRGGDDAFINDFDDRGGDTLDGGLGADRLSGGSGYMDVLDYSARTTGVTVSTDGRAHDGAMGEGDNVADDFETIQGGAGDDYLVAAGVLLCQVYGNGGNDTLVGDGNGLYGGPGDDVLMGVRRATRGNGYDGGPGSDTLIGTATGDSFTSIDGELDRIFGNGGDDTAHVDRRRDKLDSVKTVLFT